MKNILLPFLILFFISTINAQAIFDASIHTAIPFGDVNSPANEGPQNVIDQDPNTKYLDFNLFDGIAFEVDLLGEAKVASIFEIVTANDAPARDPIQFIISGSNDGIDYTEVATGEIPCNPERFLSRTFGFENDEAYSFYRVEMSGICDPANSNQVADVQLYSVIGEAPVITCPDTVSVSTDAGQCGGIAEYDVEANDLEDGPLFIELVSGFLSGSEFPVGLTSVIYSTQDSDGNLSSCNITVLVTDSEAPTANCPDDMVVIIPEGQTSGIADYEVSATDNCSVINPKVGFIPLGTIGESSYYLSQNAFTPIDALTDALNLGGFIGTIRSANDEAFLLDAILRIAFIDVLIGYWDVPVEGSFEWISGDPSTYTNWNVDEPNDAGAGEDYTVMIPTVGWNDVAEDAGPFNYLYEEFYVPLQIEGIESGGDFPLGETVNTFEFYDVQGNLSTCSFTITVDIGNVTQDEYLSSVLSLSPNPAQSEIILNNEATLILQTANLYAINGKQIKSFDFEGTTSDAQLDIQDLESGIYFLEIQSREGVITKKLIKD